MEIHIVVRVSSSVKLVALTTQIRALRVLMSAIPERFVAVFNAWPDTGRGRDRSLIWDSRTL